MLYFLGQHLPLLVPPESIVSGFVYTKFHSGAKAFRVELIGEKEIIHADFVVPVEGFRADFMNVDPGRNAVGIAPQDLDMQEWRGHWGRLPCCVLGGDSKTEGDPSDLVVVGSADQILGNFVTRGWDLSQTLRGGQRCERPFHQSLAPATGPLRDRRSKARGTVDERNPLRLWLAPFTVGGVAVWVGQISRGMGIKLSSKTVITQKNDPVVDEASLYVTLDLAASGNLKRYGHVRGVGSASPKAPRYNYTLDPHFTDGLRVVLFFSDEFCGYDDIQWLNGETLPRPGE